MRRHGFTLVEMLVAIVLGSLIVGALYGVDVQYRRYSVWQNTATEAHDAYRVAQSILSAELREAVPSDGDVELPGEDSLLVRTPVGFAVVCAVKASPAGISLAWSIGRMPATSTDSILLYTQTRWKALTVEREVRPGQGGLDCPYPGRTTPDHTYRLASGQADSVPAGAPVRAFVHQVFHGVMDGGELWLARTDATGTQLLAGPMAPGGIRFRFLDAAGAPTAVLSNVKAVELRLIFPTMPRSSGPGAALDTLTTLFQGRNG